MNDQIKVGILGGERRYMPATITRAIDGGDDNVGAVIEGVAALIDVETDLGWMRETIAPGAFDEVLSSPDLDCRCLFNHDSNMVLARKSAKVSTLELFKNADGHLAFRYTTPNRQFAKDLADSIAAGDVSQCSFQFRVKEQRWVFAENPNDQDLRIVEKVGELMDVGPVTFAAYPDTSVAKRSMEKEKKIFQPESSKRMKLLNARYMFNSNKK